MVTYPPLRLWLCWLPVSDSLAPFMPFYDSCWHSIPGARCVISAWANTPVIRRLFQFLLCWLPYSSVVSAKDCGNDWKCQTETDLELSNTACKLKTFRMYNAMPNFFVLLMTVFVLLFNCLCFISIFHTPCRSCNTRCVLLRHCTSPLYTVAWGGELFWLEKHVSRHATCLITCSAQNYWWIQLARATE